MISEKCGALTPSAVDALCVDFNEKKAAADVAGEAMRASKAALIDHVQRLGYVPAGADKSVRLDGAEFVATVTTSSTVEIEDGSVVELQLALSAQKKPGIFRKMFDRRVKYSLRKDAAEILKAATVKLPESSQKSLAQLFASCFSVSSKAPSLSVESSAALKAKEEKAAKKAAKKGGAK